MTTSAVGSSGSSAPLLVNGIISGINTQQVIQALLQSYSVPITNLKNQQSTLNGEASDYQTLNTDMQSLMTAANALNTSGQWNLAKASSSATSVATATSSPGAQTGSITFDVTQLAQANMLISQGGVASTGSSVTSASSLLVATGAPALGFTSLAAGSKLALGSHSIKVTQASAAATVAGGTLSTSTPIVIGSANNTLSLSVNGKAYSLALASGSYTPSALAAAINSAAGTAGAPIGATLTATGAIKLSTTEQGSAASISVSGGTALSALGLSSGQASAGTNAVVSVDGTSTTLSAITANQSVTLNAPTGSIQATIAASPGSNGSLVSTGSAQADLVSTGNGSLSSVVTAINNAGLGATASAVQQSSGSYLLQVSANATGLAGAVTLDPAAFSGSALGSMQTIAAAQNAEVSVGGTGGYTMTSASDTFNGLLAGTAVTAASTGTATVTVSPDAAGEASAVQRLVSAANQALSDINTYAGYNAATKTGGPLMGSSVVNALQQQIQSIFASVTGASSLGSSAAAGITVKSNGTISFDQATFTQAFAQNPGAVAALFTQGGTFAPASGVSPSAVSFTYAGTHAAPGSYNVSISHSATQATDTGAVLSTKATTSAEQLTITQGSQKTTFQVSAGAPLTSIASGLNQAFAAAGMSLTASTINSGTQLQITSDAYGSSAGFTVASNSTASGTTGLGGATANTATSFSGSDVAGTINGVAATGTGQVLAAPTSDPTLQGLSVLVTASGITSATSLGSFTYQPGIAQQLAAVGDAASNTSNGSLTSEIKGLQNEATGLNSQIANYQTLESQQQTVLQNQFATMESTLGTLKNESSQFASAVSGLPGF